MSNEKIYTIKINEAMNQKCGCPLCTLEQQIERDEIERILGASMMEPDVRIKTNEQGFCHRHFEALLKEPNRLSLALMTETHLRELVKKLYADTVLPFQKTPDPKKQLAVLNKNQQNCYLCSRINTFMAQAMGAFVYMYKSDSEFDARLQEQPYICLKHTRKLFEIASKGLSKDLYKKFCQTVNDINIAYATELVSDVNWFCKKFDYRYKDEDWKNSKDSVERAVNFLKE